MKTHLSSEQLDGALTGRPGQEASRHLAECAQCAGELVSLRDTLSNFREAASVVAEHHRRFASTPGALRLPRMAWGLAAAALFVSIATPLAVHRRMVTTPVAGPALQVPAAISDEALLNNVRQDLSASVPESLLPLAGTSTHTTDSTNTKE